VETAVVLEVAAHGVTAVLAAWLGLTVATRSPTPPARIFATIAIAIAVWSTSVIIERLSSSEAAELVARRLEELMVVVALPAVGHLSLVIARDGRPSRREQLVVAALYPLNAAVAVPTLLDPTYSPQALAGRSGPDAAFAWAWVAVRLAPLALGATWLLQAFDIAEGPLRRRQLAAAIATVVTGGLGAALRVVPGVADTEAWIGVSLVAVAVVLAAYAVFSAGIFFGPAVAGRAFRTSILGGAALVALVVTLLGLDAASRAFTGLDVPFLPLLALVVAIAIYEPVASWISRALGEGAPGATRERLLRALGQHDLTTRPADAGVGPALHRLANAIGVDGLAVVRPDGMEVAVEGVEPTVGTVRPIPLVVDGRTLGELRVGRATSGRALSRRDEELLNLAAAYVASALRAGIRETEQAVSLDKLVAERAAVEAQAVGLHAALVDHGEPPPGLVVHALGPLRVERGGMPIERWGGDKAGSRQAQAVFAFLFDRGERGVMKEEVLELVWPDTDLAKADLAFHRTLVGLRQTLEPGIRGRAGTAILFRNDRYRLGLGVVAWSDVGAFLAALDRSAGATSVEERIERLTAARQLYRGDYLDDCPFYGDSVHVEETRVRLRGRLIDVLLGLGEAYESVGDRTSAAAVYREAVAGPDGCPPAEAGLVRLGFTAVTDQPGHQNA
jgi:hypothetical protein